MTYAGNGNRRTSCGIIMYKKYRFLISYIKTPTAKGEPMQTDDYNFIQQLSKAVKQFLGNNNHGFYRLAEKPYSLRLDLSKEFDLPHGQTYDKIGSTVMLGLTEMIKDTEPYKHLDKKYNALQSELEATKAELERYKTFVSVSQEINGVKPNTNLKNDPTFIVPAGTDIRRI